MSLQPCQPIVGLVKGDKEPADGAAVTAMRTITQTMVMSSTSGTIRHIEAHHDLDHKYLFKDNPY